MKVMEHPNGLENTDIRIAIISGMICGIIKMLDITLLTDTYVIVLLKVFITAVIGGLGGVAGKHLFSWLKKKYELKFKKK